MLDEHLQSRAVRGELLDACPCGSCRSCPALAFQMPPTLLSQPWLVPLFLPDSLARKSHRSIRKWAPSQASSRRSLLQSTLRLETRTRRRKPSSQSMFTTRQQHLPRYPRPLLLRTPVRFRRQLAESRHPRRRSSFPSQPKSLQDHLPAQKHPLLPPQSTLCCPLSAPRPQFAPADWRHLVS